VNAQRVLRIRPATSVVNLVTSPATAKTHPKRVLDVVALVVLVVQPKSATSAQRLVTLPVTALRLVATVVVVAAATVETKADTAAVLEVTEVVVAETTVDKPVTPAVVMVTCPATALRAKSATTAVRLDIFPETAPLRLRPSELATSASNLVTSRLNAPTRLGVRACM